MNLKAGAFSDAMRAEAVAQKAKLLPLHVQITAMQRFTKSAASVGDLVNAGRLARFDCVISDALRLRCCILLVGHDGGLTVRAGGSDSRFDFIGKRMHLAVVKAARAELRRLDEGLAA